MSYGLTDTGFVRKTLLEVQADLEDALKSAFGDNIRLDNKSVFGKLVGTFAQPIADVWELAEAVYNAMYPSSATTTSALDGTCELVGVTRNAGVQSTVQCVLEGTSGTTIAAESKVATETVGDQFQTTAAITLAASVAVSSTHALIGSVTNGKLYRITINGIDFDYTATVPSDDEDAVGAGLVAAINAGAEPVVATDLTGGEVRVDALTADLATLLTLANELKADYEAHRILTSGPVHQAADTTNTIAAADATDLSSLLTLANELKADYNAHADDGTAHYNADTGNDVTEANATDLETAALLLDDLKTQYNAHRLTVGGSPVHQNADTANEVTTAGLPTAFTVAVNANVQLVTVGNLQAMESVEADAVQGFADTINQIVSPIGGWTAAWNPLDATLGSPEETDSELRQRRAVSISSAGAGTPEAILAGLLDIDSVTAAFVQENVTDETDAYGLPPHSIECVVQGGAAADIGAVLWARKPAGIELHGDESVTVEDSQGYSHVLAYSRPTEVLQWLRCTYTLYDEEEFPANGETTMAAALLAECESLGLGDDVLPDRFIGPVFDSVQGLESVLIEIADDVAGSPGSYGTTPKSIDFDELASITSARITIVGP
jgi:uncharacterized phage protein gp47/JayE